MPAVGFDVGDDAVRFIELKKRGKDYEVGLFGEKLYPANFNLNSDFLKSGAARGFLSALRQSAKLNDVCVSLPDNRAYFFETEISNVPVNFIYSALEAKLEEFVPLSAKEVIFDYEIIPSKSKSSHSVSVSVVPRNVVLEFLETFQSAGFSPKRFALAGQALAKAVVKKGDQETRIIVYMGKTAATIYIARGNSVLFSLSLGEENLERSFSYDDKSVSKISVRDKKEFSKEAFDRGFVNDQFLHSIKDELIKVNNYWLSRGKLNAADESETTITSVVFCGPGATMNGFVDFFNHFLPFPATLAQVWVNVFDLDKVTPPIPFSQSLAYANAIGLALLTYEE